MGPGRYWDRRSDRDNRSGGNERGRGGGGYRGGRGWRDDRPNSIVPKHTSSFVPRNSVPEVPWTIPKVLSARDMDAYDDDVHCDRYAAKLSNSPNADVKPKVELTMEVKTERLDLFAADDTTVEMKYDPRSAASSSSSSTTFSAAASSSYFKRDFLQPSTSSGSSGLCRDEPASNMRSSSRPGSSSYSVEPAGKSSSSRSSSSFTIPGLGNIGSMNADEEDEFLYGDDATDSGRGIPGLGDLSAPKTSSERRGSQSRQNAVASGDPRHLGKVLKDFGYDAAQSTLVSSTDGRRDQNEKLGHVVQQISDLFHKLHDGSSKSISRSNSTSDPRLPSSKVGASDPRSNSSSSSSQPRRGSLDRNEQSTTAASSYPVHQEVAPVARQYSEFPPDHGSNHSHSGYDNFQYDAYYGDGYSAPLPPQQQQQQQHQGLHGPIDIRQPNYPIPPLPPPLPQSMYPPFPALPPAPHQTQPVESQISRHNLKVIPLQTTSISTAAASDTRTSEQQPKSSAVKTDAVKVPTTLEERMQLKGEYAQQQKKLELLRVELERLRRQQGELMRKKQKQVDGHNDPQLVKNGKLQDDYVRQISSVEKALSGIEKALKASEGLSRSVHRARTSSSDRSTSATRSDSKSSTSTDANHRGTKSSAPTKRYQFVESGENWCKHCGSVFMSAVELLKHLHSDHANILDSVAPADRLWASKPKEPKLTVGYEVIIKKFQGIEFVIPCAGFYCELCKEFSGDHIAARMHLESERHNANYQKHCHNNPNYARRIQAERAASVARKREEKKRKVEKELKEAILAKKQKVARRDSDMEISDEDDDVVAIQPPSSSAIRLNLLNEKENAAIPESSKDDGKDNKSSSKIAIKLKGKASTSSSEPLQTSKGVAASTDSEQQRTQQRILSNLHKNKKNRREKADVSVQQPSLEEFVSLTTGLDGSKADMSATPVSKEPELVSEQKNVKITPQLPKEPEPASFGTLTLCEQELLPPGVDHISVNAPLPCSKPRSSQPEVSPLPADDEPAREFGPQLPDFILDDDGLDSVLDYIQLPVELENLLSEEGSSKCASDEMVGSTGHEDPMTVSSSVCDEGNTNATSDESEQNVLATENTDSSALERDSEKDATSDKTDDSSKVDANEATLKIVSVVSVKDMEDSASTEVEEEELVDASELAGGVSEGDGDIREPASDSLTAGNEENLCGKNIVCSQGNLADSESSLMPDKSTNGDEVGVGGGHCLEASVKMEVIETQVPEQQHEEPEPEKQQKEPEPEKQPEGPEPQKQQEEPEPEKQPEGPEPQKQPKGPEPEMQPEGPEPQKQQEEPEPEKQPEGPEPQKHQQEPEKQQEAEEVDVKPDIRLLNEAIARSMRPQKARCSRGRGRGAAAIAAIPMLARVKIEPGLKKNQEEAESEEVSTATKISCRGGMLAKRGRSPSQNVGNRVDGRAKQLATSPVFADDELTPHVGNSCKGNRSSSGGEEEVSGSKVKSERVDLLESDAKPCSNATTEAERSGVTSPTLSELSLGDMEVVDEVD